MAGGCRVSDAEAAALGDRMTAGDFYRLKTLWLVSCAAMFLYRSHTSLQSAPLLDFLRKQRRPGDAMKPKSDFFLPLDTRRLELDFFVLPFKRHLSFYCSGI